ncbi:MAG: FecR domain-containing protein [Thermodesulfobacteriota bacterium]
MPPARHLLPLVVVLGLLVAGSALAADLVGRVAVMEGEASAVAENGQRRALAPRAPIEANDTIETGQAGKVQIFFLDETVFTVGPDSAVKIDRFVFDPQSSAGELLANAARGTFRMVTGKISRHNPDRVQVKTPAATIGIRGCYLVGSINPAQQSLTLLFLGGLQGAERGIYAQNEAGATGLTIAGFGVEVAGPQQPPSPPVQFGIDQIRGLLAPTEIQSPAGGGPAGGPSGDSGTGGGDAGAGGDAGDGGGDAGDGGGDAGTGGDAAAGGGDAGNGGGGAGTGQGQDGNVGGWGGVNGSDAGGGAGDGGTPTFSPTTTSEQLDRLNTVIPPRVEETLPTAPTVPKPPPVD